MTCFPDCSAPGEAAGVALRHRIPIKPKGRPSLTLAVRSSVRIAPDCSRDSTGHLPARSPPTHGSLGKGCRYPWNTLPSAHCSQGSCLVTGCSSGSQHTDKGVSVREPELLRGNCQPSQVQLAVPHPLRQTPRPSLFCTHTYWKFHCILCCVY